MPKYFFDDACFYKSEDNNWVLNFHFESELISNFQTWLRFERTKSPFFACGFSSFLVYVKVRNEANAKQWDQLPF